MSMFYCKKFLFLKNIFEIIIFPFPSFPLPSNITPHVIFQITGLFIQKGLTNIYV